MQEATNSSKRGDVEALLRREGRYGSQLAWRKQLALYGAQGLAGAKPGRKPELDVRDQRISELERHFQFLENELARFSGRAQRASAASISESDQHHSPG